MSDRLGITLLSCTVMLLSGAACAGNESFEFVAEHLPEALMNNQYASLPIWAWQDDPSSTWQRRGSVGYARTASGTLQLRGPLLGAAVHRRFNETWSGTAFAFGNRSSFQSSQDVRPFETLFLAAPPFTSPAGALVSNLIGTARAVGTGFALARQRSGGWLGNRWIGGLLWQRVELADYAADYRITNGGSSGMSGHVDYSADYQFVTAVGGIEWQRNAGNWNLAPHVMAALPLPQRGLAGRIIGPGFDLRGDTATAGFGKHMGDPYIGFGMTFTYRPLGLSVDAGATLSQIFLEKLMHRGLDSNLELVIGRQF